jgi:hypothetical protein
VAPLNAFFNSHETLASLVHSTEAKAKENKAGGACVCVCVCVSRVGGRAGVPAAPRGSRRARRPSRSRPLARPATPRCSAGQRHGRDRVAVRRGRPAARHRHA